MNHCTLMAELISDPQLRYTQDTQTAIAEFTVVFPGLKADDAPQQMKVLGWGNLAQEIQQTYHMGDRVLLEGRLSITSMERPEGFREKQVEMTAQRVYGLNTLGALPIGTPPTPPPIAAYSAPPPPGSPPPLPPPVAVAPPVPAPVAPTPEPEVDYDDIPF
ncbi:single-stranded DNA-binding protein [Leptolyngbya sp. PCC 6406]|uniref:single-stranded DNA-binding protein n=1 Tax=Leptolyngbya sp. PCC 6406 TaxID=1173264 RepID=UPI0002AC71A3|nr:single-stranded DNA-binding protein [Leptolyngbya sp. PCC 6406]